MILIADSGSTKTTWLLFDKEKKETCQTAGINPYHQGSKAIEETLIKEFTLNKHVKSIFFYGAGCTDEEKKSIITGTLNRFFFSEKISIEGDLMAAARSLCQDSEGIACILGTGSNSCYYNGTRIIKNVPPLGYILGDEGSGSVLGIKLISDILKNQIPTNISKQFFDTYHYTQTEILETVYKKPFPNRFTANFTKFIHKNIHEEYMKNLVKNGFNEFFSRNIIQYSESKRLPINFTGGIAYHFKDLLIDTATELGFKVGSISQNPITGLVKYHQKDL